MSTPNHTPTTWPGMLWGELMNDDERIRFLKDGGGTRTGIMAPAIVDGIVELIETRRDLAECLREFVQDEGTYSERSALMQRAARAAGKVGDVMQLTPEQLDIAARKLCELWNLVHDDIHNRRMVIDSLKNLTNSYAMELAAIIHAVTSEPIGSRTDNERFAWLATTCSGAGFHEISSSAHKKWVSRPAIGNIARAFRESIDEVIYDIEGTQQNDEV